MIEQLTSKEIFKNNNELKINDFYWESDVLFVYIDNKEVEFLITGMHSSYSKDYHPILFSYNENIIVNNNSFKKTIDNTIKIVNYISFVNNILIFPNSLDYYKKSIDNIKSINNYKDILNRKESKLQYINYELMNVLNKKSFFETGIILRTYINNHIFSIYILENSFKIELFDLHYSKLINYTYNIEKLNSFKDDYRKIIFNMIIRKKLNVNINNFNYQHYKLNKIMSI